MIRALSSLLALQSSARCPYGGGVTRRALLAAAILGLIAVVAASTLLVGRLLSRPQTALLPPPDAEASLRFQQSVVQLLLRQSGLSQREDPLIITGPEINAFLARHVEAHRLALWPLVVRVEGGWLEVAGQTSPRRLLGEGSRSGFLRLVPGALLDLNLWLVVRGRLRIDEGEGEFVVERAAIGRQTVSQRWLWGLLGVSPSDLLVWRLPRVVERVDLEPGRVVIHTRRRGVPTGPRG